MPFVAPIIFECWLAEGVAHAAPPGDKSALHLCPLNRSGLLLSSDEGVIHSLVLDSNVLGDIVYGRFEADVSSLIALLTRVPLELNPTYALIEQRIRHGNPSEPLRKYAEFLASRFGVSEALVNLPEFEASLESCRAELKLNVALLAAYVPVIIFLYHRDWGYQKKLETLVGLVVSADLPIFVLQVFFAALVFLAKDAPELF